MGEVLIAGTASLLICVFLSPKFISFLRAREFGQNIREDGPEGHHAKAGTPTMGGIIIFTAIAVPFLLLTDWGWSAVGVFGVAVACALLGFADDYTKIVKRRSLGLRARTKLGVTIAISLGLWWVAHHKAGLPHAELEHPWGIPLGRPVGCLKELEIAGGVDLVEPPRLDGIPVVGRIQARGSERRDESEPESGGDAKGRP